MKVAAIIFACIASTALAAESPGPSAEDYAAAARFLHVQSLVRNETVEPHWIGTSGRFWYQRDGAQGSEFVIVDAKGAKSSAFDHREIARALAAAVGLAPGDSLPKLRAATLSDDLARLTGRANGKTFECELAQRQCKTTEAAASERGALDSPDGRQAVFVRDDNLWLRDKTAGTERRLTTDGQHLYSWGKWPDSLGITLASQRYGNVPRPFLTFWSPDGKYLIAPRVDERQVGVYPYVEWVPTDGSLRPIQRDVRFPFPGDRGTIDIAFFIIDVASGQQKPIVVPDGYRLSEGYALGGDFIGWGHRGTQAFFLARTPGWKSAAVMRIDLPSGAVNKVLEESASARMQANTRPFAQANVRLLRDGAELIWYSERSGWGQLYLYDAETGRLKHPITRGAWTVFDIHAIDEKRREIYFTAGGREPDRDLYFRHLYRASLDGKGDVTLLTSVNADHHFEAAYTTLLASLSGASPPLPLVQADAGVFIDTWSTVERAPVTVLRSTRDGRQIAELEHADAGPLYAAGWQAPHRERVKAADGVTDLYAAYYPPQRGASGKRPVIDAAYGGAHVFVTPRDFFSTLETGDIVGAASLARLGFAVVVVDGRGTPGRSRQFMEGGYPDVTRVGVEDHVAAIRQLAERHPEMNADKVGTYGWSWGGSFAAEAILSQPQFYKVAVAGAGVYDYGAIVPIMTPMTGEPVYADGSPFRTRPDEMPRNWESLEITRLAGQLTGHLMLIYGDLDESVPPHQVFRLIDALTRANKPYDLVYLPNRTHGGSSDLYAIKRTWNYFLERLAGEHPIQ